jgi:hypothetical protein
VNKKEARNKVHEAAADELRKIAKEHGLLSGTFIPSFSPCHF